MDKLCPVCGKPVDDDSPTQTKVYCSDVCKQRAENHRYYQNHREEMIARAM